MDPKAEAVSLLKTVWNPTTSGFGELRVLGPDGPLKPLYLKLPLVDSHLEPAMNWAFKKNAEGYTINFGVNPRLEHKGTNDAVLFYNAFIADIDNWDLSREAVDKLSNCGCKPSILVKTTRGAHLYWLLHEPEPTSNAVRTRMKLLQRALHSDAVHDPARTLRLTGMLCHKTKRDARLQTEWLNPEIKFTSVDLESCIKQLWPELEVEPVQDTESFTGPMNLVRSSYMPEEIWEMYSQPAPKGTRSQLCLGFITQCLMHGWPDDDIYASIMSLPIGGHYLDRGNPIPAFLYDLERKAKPQVRFAVESSTRYYIQEASIVNRPTDCSLRLRLAPVGKTDLVTGSINLTNSPKRALLFMSCMGHAIKDVGELEPYLGSLRGKIFRASFVDSTMKYFFKDF